MAERNNGQVSPKHVILFLLVYIAMMLLVMFAKVDNFVSESIKGQVENVKAPDYEYKLDRDVVDFTPNKVTLNPSEYCFNKAEWVTLNPGERWCVIK